MILLINACVRGESRTKRLADCLLSHLTGAADHSVNIAGRDGNAADKSLKPVLNENAGAVKNTSNIPQQNANAGNPAEKDAEVCERRLSEIAFPPTDEAFLKKRDGLIAGGHFTDPMFALAREFAAADTIVIAAPFWDLSFPAALKQYFEQITVSGVTFRYSETGVPIGLCRAKKLYYVTTAGGPVFESQWAYGYGYIRAMAQGYYGITDTALIKAEGLDIIGADVEAILSAAERDIAAMFS